MTDGPEQQREYWARLESRPLLHHKLDRIEHKLDLLLEGQGEIMADVTALNAAIDELDADEVAAVAEFQALSEQIAQLTTERAPTQGELDAITSKVTAAAEALKAGTPTPPAQTPPAETPATPPAS